MSASSGPVRSALELGRVHFVGIGGAGMSGLALVCARLGAQVTGSDRSESSYTARLAAAGIEAAIGHAAAPPRAEPQPFFERFGSVPLLSSRSTVSTFECLTSG